MVATTTNRKRAANPLAGYVPVKTITLRSIHRFGADLFVQYNPRQTPLLYCRAGRRLDPEHLHEIQQAGVDRVYVRNADFYKFSDDVHERLDVILQEETITPTEKYAVLQVAIAFDIEQSLRLVDCGKLCDVAERVGHDLVELVTTDDVLPEDLFCIARHDFHTFTHATNVASYCVILAEQMGVSDRDDLRQMATAAMLHDIGKRFIPASILTKPGRLSAAEREIIETHPTRGYEELYQRSDLTFGQLMMVYQHHERVDGTGYPVRIRKDEIHSWASILSVVDVFDAMTAKRPYRRPATLKDVLEYQRQRAGTHFDEEVVQCWISIMTQA
jgi:HD-GYP domain-containing protein (c-di-GMP phosphodiesterase class II)